MDLRIGDELIEQVGPIAHKMVYVGVLGFNGEDVLNPAKGTEVQLVSFYSIPNWRVLRTVNRPLGPNCEHICSYVRTGKVESPQLQFWSGAVAVAALALLLPRFIASGTGN
jgi:hypothetical protein